jgi:hypothetical protein
MYGAGYTIVVSVLVACLAAMNPVSARLWAGVAAVTGGVLLWRFGRQVPNLARGRLPNLMRSDRTLGLAVYAVVAGPCLILLYALLGSPWALVLAMVTTAAAELAVVFGSGRDRD